MILKVLGYTVAVTGAVLAGIGLLFVTGSSFPAGLSGLSSYRLPLALALVVFGGATSIYGLGIGNNRSLKERFIDLLDLVAETF